MIDAKNKQIQESERISEYWKTAFDGFNSYFIYLDCLLNL